MSNTHLLRLLIAAAALAAAAAFLTTADATKHDLGWIPTSYPAATCDGSMAECMADGAFQMDSESNRRMLATTSFISYNALQANSIPCSNRGASYYNCQPGAQVNPYLRSCTTATQCRS